MARVDRDFREVVVNNLLSINKILSENDVENDIAAMNRLTHTVSFLEDLIYPYANLSKPTAYHPLLRGNIQEQAHNRIRECVKVAKAVALMPPKRITDDATSFTPTSGEDLSVPEEDI
jgi:hypothetical protein